MPDEEPRSEGAIPEAEAVLASFPDFRIDPGTETGAAFLAHGAATFHQAARLLRRLPYGRNTDRTDPSLVLVEGRGTCSTKHALLACLAAEHGAAVELVVGIYEMTGANTPGVGGVLARHGIASLPEAHCYLRHAGVRLDVTREVDRASEPIAGFLSEHVIAPEGIGAPKLALHRSAMERWVRERMPEWTADQAWRVREACIAALAEGGTVS